MAAKLMIEDKIYRLINGQNTLKNNLREALQSIGIVVGEEVLLKDYPEIIRNINIQQNNSGVDSSSISFNSTVLNVDHAAQGGALGSNISLNVDNIDYNNQESIKFDSIDLKNLTV